MERVVLETISTWSCSKAAKHKDNDRIEELLLEFVTMDMKQMSSKLVVRLYFPC